MSWHSTRQYRTATRGNMKKIGWKFGWKHAIEDRKDDMYSAVEGTDECRPEPECYQPWRSVTNPSKRHQWFLTLNWRSVTLTAVHCSTAQYNTAVLHYCHRQTSLVLAKHLLRSYYQSINQLHVAYAAGDAPCQFKETNRRRGHRLWLQSE